MPPAPALLGRPYEELIRLELDGGEIDLSAYPGGPDAFVAARRAQLTPGDYAPRDIHLANGRIIETKARETRRRLDHPVERRHGRSPRPWPARERDRAFGRRLRLLGQKRQARDVQSRLRQAARLRRPCSADRRHLRGHDPVRGCARARRSSTGRRRTGSRGAAKPIAPSASALDRGDGERQRLSGARARHPRRRARHHLHRHHRPPARRSRIRRSQRER